jgi:hypothetical protein
LFAPLSLPPILSTDSTLPLSAVLQPLHPTSTLNRALVGKYIYYDWPVTGLWLGKITTWTCESAIKIWREVIHFILFYDFDQITVDQILCLDIYCADKNRLDPDHSWVFLFFCLFLTSPAPGGPQSMLCEIGESAIVGRSNQQQP